MSGNGCACSSQDVSPETSWPISAEAPAGSDAMSWETRCVWDCMSFPVNVLQVSAPVEIRNPNNVVLFRIVIISQSAGSPQLGIRFAGSNGETWEVISGVTNITTLGLQIIGAVTGITYPYVRAEMMSTNGTATAGVGCFCISEG
ncbi:MAG: hypothetical protein K8T20_08275 [Planctomycetes bacterium]|nr:hypothetical protein [Planctomycetota bacterium]